MFDTARAYGDNERLLARGLRRAGADVTRADRDEGRHGADGRQRGSRTAARRRSAPTARRASPLSTACRSTSTSSTHPIRGRRGEPRVRALARLVDDGLVRRVGLANVNRAPARRGARARPDRGRPGRAQPPRRPRAPRRSRRALRRGGDRRDRPLAARRAAPGGPPRSPAALAEVADARGATPAEVALAWLLELSPAVVAIPGARRPETARSAARAATLRLDAGDRAALAGGARAGCTARAPARPTETSSS